MLGRLDDVVITGGHKVDLADVEQAVQRWAAHHKTHAGVIAIPDPVWGTTIMAVSDSPGSLEDLQSVVRQWLPAYAVPRELIYLDQLPWLPNGKPDRAAIRSMILNRPCRAAGDRVTAETARRPTATQWLAGARPRTLPAACSPVIAGTGLAVFEQGFSWVAAILALVVSLALQVGVNYANDYSDGIRGADTERVGPLRLVGSGLASPPLVKRAAFACFGVAGLAGLALVIMTEYWWLLVVGVACILAAWYYTGGRRPYGYVGLGEVFVFVFFGLVAVCGTVYVQVGRISLATLLTGVWVGALACAILVTNNLRDIRGDAQVGKRTMATRLGDARTRVWYVILVGLGAPADHRRGLVDDLVGAPRAGRSGLDHSCRPSRDVRRQRAGTDRRTQGNQPRRAGVRRRIQRRPSSRRIRGLSSGRRSGARRPDARGLEGLEHGLVRSQVPAALRHPGVVVIGAGVTAAIVA